MPFVTTPNKDFIRRQYDKKIIEDFKQELKRKGVELSYFGLPGPEILDIKEWRNYIDKIIAVERDKILAQILIENIFQLDFNLNNFQFLLGDIDDILIKGKDEYGTEIKFSFNLVNLDYEGGILYKDLRGESKRVKAIRNLFNRQRKFREDFLLLFTFNSRNRDEKEFDEVIERIRYNLVTYGVPRKKTKDLFDWYMSARYDYKIKIYVLQLINQLAAGFNFEPVFFSPVTYLGHENVRMVHFVFLLRYKPTLTTSIPYPRILNIPLKEVKNGRLYTLKMPYLKLK